MKRIGRVVVPNYPHHIVQQGHKRQVAFAADDDFQYYLYSLKTWKMAYGIKVCGYCLMANHGVARQINMSLLG
jgi:putative transposase